jgi:hypothetical protein
VLGASALTAAELHLLPLLSTHLTFPEIAEELFLFHPIRVMEPAPAQVEWWLEASGGIGAKP